MASFCRSQHWKLRVTERTEDLEVMREHPLKQKTVQKQIGMKQIPIYNNQ